MNASALGGVLATGGDAVYIWGAVAALAALFLVEMALLAARERDLAARERDLAAWRGSR